MLKRVVFKMLEVAGVSVFTVMILLILSSGVSPSLQAGITAGGDPCSSLPSTGDANGDDAVTMIDALHILEYLFLQGDEPVPVCNAGSDVFDAELVAKIEDFFSHVSIVEIEDPEDPEITYSTLRFSDCNLQLVNGLDATNGDPDAPTAWQTSDDIVVNGLGNLIIGYNELRDVPDEDFRSGSHNLVMGIQQSYSSVGGVLAGRKNEAAAPHVLLAAYSNHALGRATTVIGGCKNTASEKFATVTGGRKNVASGGWSVVCGGGGPLDDGSEGNEASGDYSVVGGGRARDCEGVADWGAGSLFEED